jgi:hypothetical protein
MDYSGEESDCITTMVAIALANKLARIACVALHKDRDFECEKSEMAPRCAWVSWSVKAWLAARRSREPSNEGRP